MEAPTWASNTVGTRITVSAGKGGPGHFHAIRSDGTDPHHVKKSAALKALPTGDRVTRYELSRHEDSRKVFLNLKDT